MLYRRLAKFRIAVERWRIGGRERFGRERDILRVRFATVPFRLRNVFRKYLKIVFLLEATPR